MKEQEAQFSKPIETPSCNHDCTAATLLLKGRTATSVLPLISSLAFSPATIMSPGSVPS